MKLKRVEHVAIAVKDMSKMQEIFENKLDSSMLGWADLNTWQVDHTLPVWVKAGLASSLEVRVPFLDHKLLILVNLLGETPRS